MCAGRLIRRKALIRHIHEAVHTHRSLRKWSSSLIFGLRSRLTYGRNKYDVDQSPSVHHQSKLPINSGQSPDRVQEEDQKGPYYPPARGGDTRLRYS